LYDLHTKFSLRELFKIFDVDNTGTISLSNFRRVLREEMNLYVDIEDINILFKRYDGNSDGKLK